MKRPSGRRQCRCSATTSRATRLAAALSVYTGAQYLGAGLCAGCRRPCDSAVSALPQPHLPFLGALHPWQTTFLVVGAVGMAVIVPMLFVKEPRRRGRLEVRRRPRCRCRRRTAFMRQNWKTLGAIYAAFSISSAAGFGTVAWMPTYFVRVHHWAAHDIGYVYGLMLALLGGAGVLAGARFAEWLAARGYKDAYLRAPLITLTMAGIPAILATLMPSAQISFLFLVFLDVPEQLPGRRGHCGIAADHAQSNARSGRGALLLPRQHLRRRPGADDCRSDHRLCLS